MPEAFSSCSCCNKDRQFAVFENVAIFVTHILRTIILILL